jgi:uncharacterized protein (TIGR02646 family)
MKKVFKNRRNAVEYFKWERTQGKKKHPEYSASFKHYKAVLAHLILCQSGLCAYTEFRLIKESEVKLIKTEFVKGKYKGEIKDYPIDIEHFDSRLKKDYGWRWSNLFAVYSTINQKVKRREEEKLVTAGKSVHSIMKPDLKAYDAMKLMSYEPISDQFIPNPKISLSEQEKVSEMIICLGLNNAFIKMKRSEYYRELHIRIELGETIKLHQFLTGWQMKVAAAAFI